MVFAAVGISILTFPTDTRADLREGLVSAWLFEEASGKKINDSAGTNHGQIEGGVERVAGKIGKGLQFNGKDGFVEIPDSDSLHLPDAITVAAWMNVTSGGNHAAICWKGNMVGWGPNFSWRVATTSDTNMTWGRCNAGTEGWFATDNVISTGTWYHVALMGDGTQMWAFVNGEDVTGLSGQGGMNTPGPYQVFEGQPVEIGVGRGVDGQAGNDTYFNGIIDEVLIYDRMLDEDELQQLVEGASVASELAVDPAAKLTTTWANIKR